MAQYITHTHMSFNQQTYGTMPSKNIEYLDRILSIGSCFTLGISWDFQFVIYCRQLVHLKWIRNIHSRGDRGQPQAVIKDALKMREDKVIPIYYGRQVCSLIDR